MTRPTVLIIGAGFGGLFAARALAGKPVDVLLIDRNNFHTFTPLLYQVATCALDPSEIAYPIRTIFRGQQNIRTLMGEVTAVNTQQQSITVKVGDDQREVHYDYLLMAAGSTPNHFGLDDIRRHAFDLRTLHDSVTLRNHILRMFEEAAWTEDEALRQALTTIVVVGGGPTGLETAGAVYELYNHVLQREYNGRSLHTRVVLVEMQPHLLAPYPPKLRKAAAEQLTSLGVDVVLGNLVQQVEADRVVLADGTVIPTRTLVWSAGVNGSPLAEMLGVPLAAGGRVPIEPTTEVKGVSRVFAVGDMAYLEGPDGRPYPMLIPVAQQQGQLAAANILADLEKRPFATFTYHDRGMMATIGRRRAVAWIYNKVEMSGYLAWLAWLALHLVTLLGFRNRLTVFINWVWNYFTFDRSVRLILDK